MTHAWACAGQHMSRGAGHCAMRLALLPVPLRVSWSMSSAHLRTAGSETPAVCEIERERERERRNKWTAGVLD